MYSLSATESTLYKPLKQIALNIQQFFLGLTDPLGGWALLLIAFFDSSFLSLPEVSDILIISLSIKNPELMFYYCAMTTIGSVLGCLALFYVGHRGGKVLIQKKYAARHLKTVISWHQRFEFLTIMIPAILPPPTPFKIFVLSAGVLKMSPRKFILSVALGRSIRYFLEGYLAVKYGEQTLNHLRDNYLSFAWIILALGIVALLTFLLYRKYHSLRQKTNS